MKQTIRVLIPFGGFYETIHAGQLDSFVESEVQILMDEGKFDDYLDAGDAVVDAIDWQKAHQKYAEAYVNGVLNLIEDEFGFYPQCNNVSVRSPREYNFVNDVIEVHMGMQDWLRLHNHVDKGELAERVAEELAPRSGFIPYYSNNILDWKKPSEWLFPQTGIMMEVLLEQIDVGYEQKICDNILVHELMVECVDWDKLDGEQ